MNVHVHTLDCTCHREPVLIGQILAELSALAQPQGDEPTITEIPWRF